MAIIVRITGLGTNTIDSWVRLQLNTQEQKVDYKLLEINALMIVIICLNE